MYFSKVSLTLEGWKKLGRLPGTSLYAIHQLLFHLFEKDPDADRDFLFNFVEKEGIILVLSEREPLGDSPLFTVVKKPFDPSIKEGQLVRFNTTVNPVERIEIGGKRRKVGIVQNAHVQALKEGKNPPSDIELAHVEGRKWMCKRESPCGFKVEDFRVIAYNKNSFSNGKGEAPIVLDMMNATGVLRVTDVSKFKKALKVGIGSSPSFGCGMLLIAPL